MDPMLPSPGFSIPSIGTPLHQLEEDQQIVGNNPYFSSQMTPQHGMGSNSNSGMGGSNSMSGGLNSMGLPSLTNTPAKLSSYQPSYATPQSMMQPQTPVCSLAILRARRFSKAVFFDCSKVSCRPWCPWPNEPTICPAYRMSIRWWAQPHQPHQWRHSPLTQGYCLNYSKPSIWSIRAACGVCTFAC